jgi:hypothetical protein
MDFHFKFEIEWVVDSRDFGEPRLSSPIKHDSHVSLKGIIINSFPSLPLKDKGGRPQKRKNTKEISSISVSQIQKRGSM